MIEDSATIFEQLQRHLFDRGCVYAYPRYAIEQGSRLFRAALECLPHEETAQSVKVPISTSVPAVTLSNDLLARFREIGKALDGSFSFQDKVITEDADARARIMSGTEAALEYRLYGLSGQVKARPVWMRVDFVLDRALGMPMMVDINMLPGGLYFAHAIADAHDAVGKNGSVLERYNLGWLQTALQAEQLETATPWNRMGIAGPPEHPFLRMEAAHIIQLLQHIRFIEASAIPPEVLLTIRLFKFRHLNDTSVLRIAEYIERGGRFIPGPCLWRENKLWFQIFASRAKELAATVGGHSAGVLLESIPETFRLAKTACGVEVVGSADKPRGLTADDLSGWVVKPSDGAGGRGVFVCAPGVGSKTREEAWGYIGQYADSDPPLLLQRFVRPAKLSAYSFSQNAKLGWYDNPARYAVYYVNGQFVGGIVTQLASYKTQGSIVAVNLPMLWNDVRAV